MSDKAAGMDGDAEGDRGSRGVQSVDTGFALLEVLAARGGMTLAEIRAATGLSRAQVHAYLFSFQQAGLIARETLPDTQGSLYHIGPTGRDLGLAQLLRQDAQSIAGEEAQKTAEACGQTISVTVWGRYGPVVTSTLQANDEIRNSARPGTVYSVTGTATGHLFAALLPFDVTDRVIRVQRAEPEPVRFVGRCPDYDAVRPQIELARVRDMAATYSWPQSGVSALAAPVRNFSDELELVLTMIGSESALDISPEGAHAEMLRDLARRVSRRLGHVLPLPLPLP